MTSFLAFTLILATATAALLGASWPAVVACALALTLISLIEHRRYRARFAAVGMSEVFRTFALSNAGVSLVSATCAYGLGLLVRTAMQI